MTSSKYWRMMSTDETILRFNELYDDCRRMTSEIKSCYTDISEKCNEGFSNLLSGKRVLVSLVDKKWDNYLGLGSQGFGSSYYITGTLSYTSYVTREYREEIIANKSIFRAGIKKSKRFREMFSLSLKALSKIPNIHGINTTENFDIEVKAYGGTTLYIGVRASSPFDIQNSNFTVQLISSTKDVHYYNRNITSDDIIQDVTLYHIYKQLISILETHLADLTNLKDELDAYVDSKVYVKLVDELEVIRVTKAI